MISSFKIANKTVSSRSPVFIIAEAGVNHNGRLDLALKLVDAAAEAGADAVKFQTFKAEQVVTRGGKMAEYQKRNLGKTESQLEMLKSLELKEEFYKPIMQRCRKRKIIFLSTPHGGFESIDFLWKLKVPAFKFGSGDLTNLPILRYAAKFNKPIILSTGMATIKEVEEAVICIKKNGNKKIILLHCTTDYPCRLKEVNLAAMQIMAEKFHDLAIGYSDHTTGYQVPMMAVTLGAQVVEKHFTLDKKMKGPDHKASANPIELKNMVEKIRSVKTIMGQKVKKPAPTELKYIPLIRKSLVSLREIKKGEKLTKDNIGIKRPGTGIPPKEFENIIGKTAKKNIKVNTLLKQRMFKN